MNWLRIWHFFAGHPRTMMHWGSFEDGARCKCGYTFHYWDLIP